MLEVFHKLAPYALPKAEKEKLLLSAMRELTEWHRHRCVSYQRYLDAIGYDPAGVKTLENVPFLPIRAFKELQMKSISDDAVFKVMMSSGTSGQNSRGFIWIGKQLFCSRRCCSDCWVILSGTADCRCS